MTSKKRISKFKNLEEQTNILFKIVDKLENRISTLEKVLESHAKCIGQLREEKFIPIRKDQIDEIEKELER
jgi:exonuclease VII small subunit